MNMQEPEAPRPRAGEARGPVAASASWLRRALLAIQVSLALILAFPAVAQTVSVPFMDGFVGAVGQNTSKADNIVLFSTLGFARATFEQQSTTGQFGGVQGNDLSGILRLYRPDGTSLNIPGALNWRITDKGTIQYFGYIPTSTNPVVTITYPGGTYQIGPSSNFGAQVIGSTLFYTDGSNVSGNASASGLVSGLNSYLAQFQSTAPVLTGPGGVAGATAAAITVNENQTAVTTYTANKPVTWSITGGTDAGKFTINPATGVLTFIAAPDYENPTDSNLDQVYVVTIRATEPGGFYSYQTLSVTVADVLEPVITGPGGVAGATAAAITVNENQTAVTTYTANKPVTWSISGGTDAGKFTINPATGVLTFIAAPDYENPTDSNLDRVYVVTVRATDAGGLVVNQTLSVTVADIYDPVMPVITSSKTGVAVSDHHFPFDCASGAALPGTHAALPGTCIEYRITVSSANNGAVDAVGFTVVDMLPADIDFVAVLSSAGFDSVSVAGDRITGIVNALQAGGSAQIVFRATIK
ncbi:hypothetical protein [Defluviimonas salinarum]|uniref:Cadherin domain-containing protein n=1 Tax=Defluviimonas salinarum TaxID=2992147 RepID=A0ABT3J5D5_9RHOB|nr:hypothetical protein [Defluviimonas salinarum]MCW3782893.1 hypothetical protein [Defluviimonas salinarum]